jgi:guanylate kinase
VSGDPRAGRRTFPLVLSAPSGAGKTTLARRLRERRGDIVFSVSATTRAPRDGEVDGRDYHFVGEGEFRRMIDAGELIEWAPVHGNHYGTPLKNVAESEARGHFLVLDIDIQGAAQIRQKVPQAVHVFVMPPSGEVLCDRLLKRGSESDEARRRRLKNARDEIQDAARFDYVVVNDDLERAVDELEAILAAESLRVSRLPALDQTVRQISAEIEAHLAEGTPSPSP